ncbi:hypothetical protein HMPREF1863_00303 [Aedoeadaptatus coxii]|uniref:Uncharacterized protein n=1 Tax=Aedoeadaptatus coxii TaxID=755172 RepID=A0A134AKP3_9FIRM|nr:hypothetical protein HMPREF1863_00303 [Peptoniphilus coxii]
MFKVKKSNSTWWHCSFMFNLLMVNYIVLIEQMTDIGYLWR